MDSPGHVEGLLLQHPPTPLRYRPDVDGLRAVAVLSVVAYHAHLPFVTGGFVGVDVFFVISGYLISAIIMRDIARDSFSVVSFYERRVRRIFPAMLVMMFVVTLMSAYLLLPDEVMSFARSLLAALFSGSNFIFWHQAGYFDDTNAFKPLLHTWSLAVEEQFYLLFPPFLLVLRRFAPRWTKAAIFAVAGISFVVSQWVVKDHAAAAFYFTPLRAWELLLGAILSQQYLPAIRGAMMRHLASVLGIVLILVPVFVFTETTVFPGLAALAPCAGAGLIIAAGVSGSSVIGRVLSWKPVVFVGLISYSLYLWHWPVLVFQATDQLVVPRRLGGLHVTAPILLLVCVALGTLSWAFVERPFRTKRFGRREVFLLSAAAVAVLTVMAGGLIVSHGLPRRYPVEAREVGSYLTYPVNAVWRSGTCFITPEAGGFKAFQPSTCLAEDGAKGSILLLGDSHAASLYPGLKAVFPDRNVLQANSAGCRSLVREPAGADDDCRKMSDAIYRGFLENHKVDWVVLAGRWYPREYGALDETLAWLRDRGIRVVIAGRNPEYDEPLPRLLANRIRNPRADEPQLHFGATSASIDRQMEQRADAVWHEPYVSFFEAYCKPDCAVYAATGVPMLSDSTHLTVEGGRLFDEVIGKRIKSIEAGGATQ